MRTHRTDDHVRNRDGMAAVTASQAANRRLVAYGVICTVSVAGQVLIVSGVLIDQKVAVPAAGVFFIVACLAGVALMARAATRPGLPLAARRPWWYLLAADLVLTGSAVASHLVGAQHHDRLSLAIDTVGRVAQVATNLTGLFAFAAEPMNRRDRFKLGMDVGTVLGAGLMLGWFTLIGPAINGSADGHVQVVVLLQPVIDLVLFTGVFTVLMRGSVPSARRPLGLLLVASGFLVLASALQTHDVLRAAAGHPPPFAPACALVGTALFACAAFEQLSVAKGRAPGSVPVAGSRTMEQRNHGVPYIALLFGYGLLLLAAARSGDSWWPGLVAGAILMTATVAGRQTAVLRENRELVVTDRLTGLANRYPLDPGIERAAARSRRSGTPMAVLLIDLDGFKQVNDTLGHEAGDRLLVEFAEVLRSTVRSLDVAARMGGDEFAVVLDEVTTGQAVSVAERIRESAAEGVDLGAGITPIRCSIGIAVGDPIHPDGIPGPDELLARADAAMYEAKRAGRHSWHLSASHSDPPTSEPPARGQLRRAT